MTKDSISVVSSIDEALKLVRDVYPTATKEGSTFDYSFWVAGKLVALAIANRRVKRNEWKLTIYAKPKPQ